MKPINAKAPVKCEMTIDINANSAKVWAALTNIDRWPLWNPEIGYAKINGQPEPGTTFMWKSGGTKISSTLHTVEPFTNLGWTGKAMGAFAIHNWTLTETDGLTYVHVEESMEGFLVGLFKRMFNQTLENGMRKWLDSLKRECESHRLRPERPKTKDRRP